MKTNTNIKVPGVRGTKGLRLVFALTLLLLIGAAPLQAQTQVTKNWDMTYGGSQFDYLTSVALAPGGNGYLLAGTSRSGVSGDKTAALKDNTPVSPLEGDFWVVKLNTNGTKAWDKSFGGDSTEWLADAISTSDGGYLLGGYSFSGVSGDKTTAPVGDGDYWVVKIDADGNKVWDKTFGGDGFDELTALAETSDGYLLGGSSYSGASGDKTGASVGERDYWVVKIDDNGNKVWDKTFGGAGDDVMTSVVLTPDGYLLGGYSFSGISADKTEAARGNGDFWVVKIDANGTKVWDKTFGGSGKEELKSITAASDNSGYLLGGLSSSGAGGDKTEAGRGGTDVWVIKISDDGSKAWDKTFGGTGDEWTESMVSTTGGGYLLGGGSTSGISGSKTEASQGGFDYWVLKLDADGSKTWDKAYGGSGEDWIESVAIISENNYLLGGSSDSGVGGDKTEASRGDKDFWVISITESVLNSAPSAEEYSKFEVYPNPSNEVFNLIFKDVKASAGAVHLTLRNSTGQAVVQQTLGAHQLYSGVQIPTANLKNGIYFLQIEMAGKAVTRKLVLEK